MNRKIKFRVWEHHYEKFSTQLYVFKLDKKFELSTLSDNLSFPLNETYKIISPDETFDGPVQEFTYQQSTELKDIDGNEIYEGDILQEKSTGHHLKVIWDDSSFITVLNNNSNEKFSYTLNNHNIGEFKWKVVGNIFENSNLI